MRKAVRVSLWIVAAVALVLALLFYLLYAPAPPEPELSARPRSGTIKVGELERSYLLYAPARPAAAPALLVVFHGSMGSPGKIRVETGYGFDRLADRHGFVVAYPQGYEGHWNDCRKTADYEARRLDIDDAGFFETLVAQLRRRHKVDPARIFVAGLSNGGHFVFRLALEHPDLIAGAAVFGANLPTPDNNVCAARGPPPPIMLVNGTDDPINPYEGGKVTLFGFGNRGTVLSARESAAYFARSAGATDPVTRILPRAPDDGTRVERTAWQAPGGKEVVVLLSVHGGGHVVPQAAYRPPRLLGDVTRAIDGPFEAWDFFRSQPRAKLPLHD